MATLLAPVAVELTTVELIAQAEFWVNIDASLDAVSFIKSVRVGPKSCNAVAIMIGVAIPLASEMFKMLRQWQVDTEYQTQAQALEQAWAQPANAEVADEAATRRGDNCWGIGIDTRRGVYWPDKLFAELVEWDERWNGRLNKATGFYEGKTERAWEGFWNDLTSKIVSILTDEVRLASSPQSTKLTKHTQRPRFTSSKKK